MTSQSQTGLLGKLLLPAYTDAGASTSFRPVPSDGTDSQPPSQGLQHEAERCSENKQHRARGSPIDTSGSDAQTEILDNRTSKRTSPAGSDGSSRRTNQDGTNTHEQRRGSLQHRHQHPHQHHESKFGFFPSTNRSIVRQPSQDNHDTARHHSVDAQGPQSPPEVTRRQLPVPSVAAASVVPQIGGLVDALHEQASIDRHNYSHHANGNPNADNNLQNDDGQASTSEAVTTATSASSTLLGTQFLQKVRPIAETKDERDDLRTKLRQAGTAGSSSSSSNGTLSSTSPNSSVRDPIVDANDRDEVSSDVNSTVYSEANSTASEMGTIINIANNKQRMAEVEAMAALVEASPAFQDYNEGNFEHYGSDDDGSEAVTTKLALPTLNSRDANDSAGEIPVPSSLPSSKPTMIGDAPTKAMSSSPQHNPTRLLHEVSERLAAESTRQRRETGGSQRIIRPRHDKAPKRPLTLSAPATPVPLYLPEPPRLEDLLRSSGSPQRSARRDSTNPPQSFALRSPGSAARHELSTSAERNEKSSQARRLLRQNRRRDFRSGTPVLNSRIGTANAEATPQETLTANQIAFTGPFRLAQKCFSFDSTLDDYTVVLPTTADATAKTKSWERMHRNQLPRREHSHTDDRALRQSASWDVGWSHSAVRSDAYHRRSKASGPHSRLSQGHRQYLQARQRLRLDTDFSPVSETVESLHTPQRVHIEREDAIDILACLVERGVSLEREAKAEAKQPSKPSQEVASSTDDPDVDGDNDLNNNSKDNSIPGDDDVAAELREDERVENVIDEIKKEIETLRETNPDQHAARITAIEVLSRSHSYAMEMKRASLSASTWLQSIRKPDDGSVSGDKIAGDDKKGQVEGGQSSSEMKADELSGNMPASTVDKIEITTLKALLHTAQLEAKERAEQADKLNEELSKCRAEIGRLQSVAKVEGIGLAPNRSVLDDMDDSLESSKGKDDAYVDTNAVYHDTTKDSMVRAPSPIVNDGSVADLSVNDSLFRGMDTEGEQSLRAALNEANDVIRRLHADLQQFKQVGATPPIVSVKNSSAIRNQPEDSEIHDGLTTNKSMDDMNRTVNVRMLDGENFVTEWNDLAPPLPPPPDHGLHSPIVRTVLEQWTGDSGLHDSLVSWMESILSGAELDSIPPLTISSLDHQVRDGFTMHVLPLLLRRADVHLTVQTRAHRRTTYDMAVTVKRKTQAPSVFNPASYASHDRVVDDWARQSQDFEQLSTTHSAVTAHISNASTNALPVYSNNNFPSGDAAIGHLTDTRSVKSSSSNDDFPDEFTQSNQGIMGAIGGAIGGLLSRRKQTATSPSRYGNAAPFHQIAARGTTMPIFENLPSGMHEVADVALEEQPYHRVVSAPPGRIGMTFVEFRGHAMVSDVAQDSPLSGWVFPSDILIAIDEIPVSGMRVRDIIKVLTNRKDRQRALRVISSHAMNEFTLNQTNFNEGPPT